ncbi:hypothetical protein ATN88_12500 [Enterovibrio coralii]|uniref:Uncharacterized protein n=2 Tax=Enterovibrio coralii TaxID=294935 RepID=A0A135I2S6_9GAMM|nr:hypothetical protein ATN88_12500 [Enterovibrio coralii]
MNNLYVWLLKNEEINMTLDNKTYYKIIEVIAINAIMDNFIILDKSNFEDQELLDKAISDVVVSNQVNILLRFPHLGRLKLIETLAFYEILSWDHIYILEKELKTYQDDYILDESDHRVALIELKHQYVDKIH